MFCIEIFLVRHLDCSGAKWRDLITIICLQIIVSTIKDLKKAHSFLLSMLFVLIYLLKFSYIFSVEERVTL